jgi:hypothetical protein
MRRLIENYVSLAPKIFSRPSVQISRHNEEQIEGVIDDRGLFCLPVRLKKLERRSPFSVKRGDLAVDGG